MNKVNELKKLDKRQLQSLSIMSTGGIFDNNTPKKTILNYLIKNIDKIKEDHINEVVNYYITPI